MAPGSDAPRQLSQARQQLQAAMAQIDQSKVALESVRARQVEFIGAFAQELRDRLAPIRAAASVPSQGCVQDIVAMRTTIERQVAHMSRMIDELLDVSRASTGQLRLTPGRVDINEVVAHAVDNASPAIARRGQRLEVHGLDAAAGLAGDQTRLIRVLTSLLDNASTGSPDGATIQLVVKLLEHTVELTVVDNGIGMSIKALQGIFDPFARELHVAGFNPPALGIGLAIVRDVVEAHGGRVTAASAGLGHGSRFVVTLPRQVLRAVQAS